MPPPFVTDVWFKQKKRPAEFGSVTIEFEEIVHSRGGHIVRPISVKGLVAVGSTSDRGNAPEPISGLRVSQAKNVAVEYRYNAQTGHNAYNTGIPDAEKGHIMALELGGPDIRENIVPQWAKWQGSGEWRRMEMDIKAMAEEGLDAKNPQPYYLQFHAIVGYKKLLTPSQGSQRTLSFPSHFTVYVTKLDKSTKAVIGGPVTMYDKSPMRNETDDMIAMRTFMDVERRSGDPNWDPGYSDWVEKTKESRGKKRSAGEFAEDGQDPIYVPVPAVKYPSPATGGSAYAVQVGSQLDVNKRTKLNLPDGS